jgi:hypothetical protein
MKSKNAQWGAPLQGSEGCFPDVFHAVHASFQACSRKFLPALSPLLREGFEKQRHCVFQQRVPLMCLVSSSGFLQIVPFPNNWRGKGKTTNLRMS